MRIQRLFVHPIKSLGPVEVLQARITNTGLEYDRVFILISDTRLEEEEVSSHLTIKTLPRLCLFTQSIYKELSKLRVTYTAGRKSADTVDVPLEPSASDLGPKKFTVDIFGSRTTGFDMGDPIADFFSRHLNQPARLLYIGQDGRRAIPASSLVPRKPSLFPWLFKDQLHEQQIRFADASPLLITTTASEADARARLPEEYQSEDLILRFRTNIHVDVTDVHAFNPYEEDTWKKVVLSTQVDDKEVDLDVVFRTVRCQSLNVDFETGELVPSERQLYKLLAKDRRVNPAFPMKPCFGVYAFSDPCGVTLSVGDRLRVVEYQS